MAQIKTYPLVIDAHAITDNDRRFFHLSFDGLFSFFYEKPIKNGSKYKYKIQNLQQPEIFEKVSQTDENSRWIIFEHFLNMRH
jgi:hypothetical protein